MKNHLTKFVDISIFKFTFRNFPCKIGKGNRLEYCKQITTKIGLLKQIKNGRNFLKINIGESRQIRFHPILGIATNQIRRLRAATKYPKYPHRRPPHVLSGLASTPSTSSIVSRRQLPFAEACQDPIVILLNAYDLNRHIRYIKPTERPKVSSWVFQCQRW